MKNRKSDFQSQQPPHTAPFSPNPPPPHSGRWEADSASTQLLPPPGSLPPCPGDSQGKPLGRVAGKSRLRPPETRQVCKNHACSCWHVMPSDATNTSRQHQCCAAAVLPLHCAARSPAPCLAPLPFSPCSFLSLLFSVLLPSLFFFFCSGPFPPEEGSGSGIPPFFAPILNLSAISCHGQSGRCKAWGEQPSCHLPKLEVFPGEAAVIFMTEG